MAVNTLTLSLVCGAWFAALALPVAAAPDDGVQSLTAVRRAAESALRREIDPTLSGVKFEAADLDPRLRLPTCASPLDTMAPPPRGAQTRVLVRVTCKSLTYWNINVPVDIKREATVLVLKRAVARGEGIGAADVSVQTRVLPGLASPYVSKLAELSGRTTRRMLAEGTAVTADALNEALLIHRGQSVTLAAATGGIEVRAPGQAMADAGVNQRVRVRNLNSLKIVEGVADTDGMVRVNP